MNEEEILQQFSQLCNPTVVKGKIVEYSKIIDQINLGMLKGATDQEFMIDEIRLEDTMMKTWIEYKDPRTATDYIFAIERIINYLKTKLPGNGRVTSLSNYGGRRY